MFNITKICSLCKEEKNISEFNKNKHSKDGYRSRCKKCTKIERGLCRERDRNYQRLWRIKNQDKYRSYRYKDMNSILGIYDELYEKQMGKCAICGADQNNLSKSLCLDHNHKDGTIRGLLCQNCNLALGLFQDDIEILNKAINYLKFFNEINKK